VWLEWWNTCPASVRPRAAPSILKKETIVRWMLPLEVLLMQDTGEENSQFFFLPLK
jgi:hypothetical protein